MPVDKPYLDIPGTTIFDGDQSRSLPAAGGED